MDSTGAIAARRSARERTSYASAFLIFATSDFA